ncbi:non-canonical purine NTP pyrophosphatase [Effusibacillus lacus]|uniref:Non-canonical purine NTP pyrophosphatase n=1 Tax=Effusibacillus lacus TaxID=1348429 RepID=A0A292YJF8_9BACL|nr:non-canonical purine NTP pyrophosphatase [Effusibacillus lacus]TCS75088.1 XTP/dITP diphosphohydrolase [Effusibacillus lacus]GAX89041.1 non-canonical purine NTP pyrophosphatase [Effusibacillus lacus]
MELILATWNESKKKWLQQGMADLPLSTRILLPGEVEDVEETGSTFAENALLKARAVGHRPDAIVVAEDSGLCVDALNGFPGVRTARWAPGTDNDRSALLLKKLQDVPPGKRTAAFCSAAAVLFPDGREAVYEGRLDGQIALYAVGELSDGYDRIFQLSGGLTIAQLGREKVEPVDHRRQALAKLATGIRQWLGGRV